MTPRRLAAALAASSILAAAHAADAAVGKIEFQEVEIGLSNAHGRPVRPIIVLRHQDGRWAATTDVVQFDLRVHAKVNLGSRVVGIFLGIPARVIKDNSWAAYPHFSDFIGGRSVTVSSTTHGVRGDRLLGTQIFDLAKRCAQATAGQGGVAHILASLPVEVEVRAARGVFESTIETRTKVFTRQIEVTIRCVATAESQAEPHRTKPEAHRTKPEAHRTVPEFAVIKAALAFAKAANAKGCPVAVRQSVRITSKGPGRAKFYLVKRDGKGTLSGPYYVDVTTYHNGVYVGVAQVTNTFTKDVAGTYRVVVANEKGQAVESGWVELKVDCPSTAGAGKITAAKPGERGAKERFVRVKPHVN